MAKNRKKAKAKKTPNNKKAKSIPTQKPNGAKRIKPIEALWFAKVNGERKDRMHRLEILDLKIEKAKAIIANHEQQKRELLFVHDKEMRKYLKFCTKLAKRYGIKEGKDFAVDSDKNYIRQLDENKPR